MMAVERAAQRSWVCPSCGSTATTLYCGACGEQRMGAVAAAPETADPRRSFAGRLWASLRTLASPPGNLTADWLRGKRVGYLAPLSLFLWINVAFFVVQSLSGLGILTWPLRVHLSDDSFAWLTTRLLAQHRPDVVAASNHAYVDMFDALEGVHAKSLVIVMVPAFAISLAALLFDRRVPFTHLLVFSTHFFAFALIWLCALFPAAAMVLRLIAIGAWPAPLHHWLDLVVSGLEAAVFGWYLYVALGTVFGLSRRRLLTVLALTAALYAILKAYHVVVFAATLYSI